VKPVVTFGAGVMALLLACSFSSAEPAMTGAEAVREIDWNALTAGSPIPGQMPAAQSDDPVEAGFARQWIEHVVAPSDSPYFDSKLALEIVSKHRATDDQWANGMEKELREIIHTNVPRPINVRVFCNSVGCLCYVERDVPFWDKPIVRLGLLHEGKDKFGIRTGDIYVLIHAVKPGIPWELTLVSRPSTDTPITPVADSVARLTVTPNNRWRGP